MVSTGEATSLMILGALCCISSIAGGGFEAFDFKLPKMNTPTRWLIGLFGLSLCLFSGWLLVKHVAPVAAPHVAPSQGTTQINSSSTCDKSNVTVSGNAKTTGANSPATVAGCVESTDSTKK
jgi:hypothetical protein